MSDIANISEAMDWNRKRLAETVADECYGTDETYIRGVVEKALKEHGRELQSRATELESELAVANAIVGQATADEITNHFRLTAAEQEIERLRAEVERLKGGEHEKGST